MVAKIDEAGHKLHHNLEVGDRIHLTVEGQEVTGEITRKDPRDSSCWVFLESAESLFAIYVDIIQETKPDNINHYEVDIHMVNESGGEFSWIGTVSGVDIEE